MKFLKTLLTAIGTFALLATAAEASSFTQIAQASYELYRNGIPICSGQFVKPQEFLTAGHCMKDSKEYNYSVKTVKDNISYTFELKPLHINPEEDTATLTVVDTSANFPTVDVAIPGEVPTLGQDVLLAGYPDVEGYFFGVVGTFNGEVPMDARFGVPNGRNQYAVSVFAIPGSSGSGLYTRINGEWKLIGTMHGGPNDMMNFTSTIQGVHAVL